MFYFLSKTLFVLAMPLTWVLGFMAFAFFAKNPKRKNRIILIGGLFLYLASNPFLSDLLVRNWEIPAVPLADLKQPIYEVGIVLGGVTDGVRTPKDRIYTMRGADRLLHTAMLYKKGIVKNILVTGGGLKAPEATDMRGLLLLCGVPDSCIIMEGQSLNTRENAIFSSAILKEKFPDKKCLLVTSAFHMRRALGCFEKAGVSVDPFPTDFYAGSGQKKGTALEFVDYIFPDAETFSNTYKISREILGYCIYRIIGYA
jgi:uncharacterized SAM-binding protein YcdF (DUF218 family)